MLALCALGNLLTRSKLDPGNPLLSRDPDQCQIVPEMLAFALTHLWLYHEGREAAGQGGPKAEVGFRSSIWKDTYESYCDAITNSLDEYPNFDAAVAKVSGQGEESARS